MQGITLRGLVVSHCGSAAALSRVLEWSERKTRSIVAGRQEPTLKEAEKIADALGINNADDFVQIFFPDKSTKWTRRDSPPNQTKDTA